jgi:hypothetical protein
MIFALLMLVQSGQLGPPEVLEQSFTSRAVWKACVEKFATDYFKVEKNSELIVHASFGKCNSWEQEFRTYTSALTVDGKAAFRPQDVDKLVNDARSEIKDAAVAAILDARLTDQGKQ